MNKVIFHKFPDTEEGRRECIEKIYYCGTILEASDGIPIYDQYNVIELRKEYVYTCIYFAINNKICYMRKPRGISFSDTNQYLFDNCFQQLIHKLLELRCFHIDGIFDLSTYNKIKNTYKVRWINEKIGHGIIPLINEEAFNPLVMKFVLISQREEFSE